MDTPLYIVEYELDGKSPWNIYSNIELDTDGCETGIVIWNEVGILGYRLFIDTPNESFYTQEEFNEWLADNITIFL
jgi:hypothetical protein